MKDVPNDQTDDEPSATDETSNDQRIPQTEWEVVAQVPYEPAESGGLTTTIIEGVAKAEGVPLSDIKHPPLYEVIDTAALEDALFGQQTGTTHTDCATEFMYRDFRITVQTDGWVLVHQPATT